MPGVGLPTTDSNTANPAPAWGNQTLHPCDKQLTQRCQLRISRWVFLLAAGIPRIRIAIASLLSQSLFIISWGRWTMKSAVTLSRTLAVALFCLVALLFA